MRSGRRSREFPVPPGDALAGPSRIGALLAVLDDHGQALYLSPELEDLLGHGASGAPAAGLWTMPGTAPDDHAAPCADRVVQTPAMQTSGAGPTLVRLRIASGQTRTAQLTRLPLPGLSVCVLRLETGNSPTDHADALPGGAVRPLDPEQMARLLYQLPVATVGVATSGQLLYVNAQAIRNAQMTEGAHQRYLGLDDTQYSVLRGQDQERAAQRVQNLRVSVSERRPISWVDQIQLPGQPPEYWRRTYSPVYDEHGDVSLISGTGINVTAELHRTAELELLSHVAQNNLEAILVVDIASERAGSGQDRPPDIARSRVIFANRVAQRLLDIAAPLMGEEDLRRLRPLLIAGRGTSETVSLARGTPSERCLQLSVAHGGTATTGGRYSHLCLTVRDVTDSTRARQLEEGRSRALQLSLGGAPLPQVLTELIRTLEEQLPGLIGAVQLLRGERLYLEPGAGPEPLPGPGSVRRELFSGPQDGEAVHAPCALAAQLGEDVIVSDYAHDPRFAPDARSTQRGAGAGPSGAHGAWGVRSVWSVPLRGKHGQVLGTFTVYGFRPRLPRPHQLGVLRELAGLGALLIESRRASERLERTAYHDALTGLPNRSAFMQALEDRLRGPEAGDPARPTPDGRTAVALIDLTGFRAINESYGQPTGNRLLRQVAERLQDCLPDPGARAAPSGAAPPLLARLGGDEFGLMLPLPAPERGGPLALGERLLGAVSAPMLVGDQEIRLRASIGWSLYPELAADAPTLLDQADTAMYTARQEGALQRLYSQHGAAWSLSPTVLRTALEQALDQQQLHLAYQPLCGRTGALRSFEALLRWTHPQYGPIGPDQFIPIAEMSGLIRHLGLWVLAEAAHTALSWPESVTLSVNISGRQVEHPGFADEVQAVLARSGLAPARLQLELTESALMVGSAQAIRTLQALRDLGVRVALDDYGVGYSNLIRLHTLPIDTVKLDRSFVAGLLPGPGGDLAGEQGGVNASAAIIRSVVGLAHDLGLEVVAEGVETGAQLRAVLALGCDAVQGYLHGRPVPAQEALEWLRARPDPGTDPGS